MEINLPSGRYVVAVSGGVDSMVLAHLLMKKPNLELVIAHFNHGMRQHASKDEKLASDFAKQNKLQYVIGRGSLGQKASEDTARNARYKFLNSVKKSYQAKAIITAHHQNDLIETAIINVLRGTGRRGLTSIARSEVIRPLLNIPKASIYKYAKDNGIAWHEDPTNSQTDYLRNYIRHNIVPKMSSTQKKALLKDIDRLTEIDLQSNNIFATLSHSIVKNDKINRQEFTSLPLDVGNEMVIYWLLDKKIKGYDRKTIERLALAIKSGHPGNLYDINKQWQLKLDKEYAYIGPSG